MDKFQKTGYCQYEKYNFIICTECQSPKYIRVPTIHNIYWNTNEVAENPIVSEKFLRQKLEKKGCRGYVSIHEPAWCAGVIKIKSCINACLLKFMEQHVVINIHMIAEKTSFETKQVLNKVGNMLKISRVLVYKIWRMWKGQKHLLFCLSVE